MCSYLVKTCICVHAPWQPKPNNPNTLTSQPQSWNYFLQIWPQKWPQVKVSRGTDGARRKSDHADVISDTFVTPCIVGMQFDLHNLL